MKLHCSFWPVREYPWGRGEAVSSAHSDMPALKLLLFETFCCCIHLSDVKQTGIFRPLQATADMKLPCSFWPVREYPWGRCEALSSAHSDMPALKKLLFEVAYHDLKDQTEKRYYHYREQQLLDMDDPSMCVCAFVVDGDDDDEVHMVHPSQRRTII